MSIINLKLNKQMQPKEFKLADAGGNTHPNKTPFKCALFAVDVPSDGPPEGTGGKKIRISSAVCGAYLETFVGMALNIDYVNGMSDHDPRFKVAVIEKAYQALDGMAWVEGYIYGKDFPDVVATIRYYNGLAAEYGWQDYQFGASLEMEAAVKIAEDDPEVLDVVEFCGTGAAILFAEKAAYKMTSFAAKNKTKETKEVVTEMTPEEIKAAMTAALGDFSKSITASVEKAVGEVKSEVGAIKQELDAVKAAKVEADKKAADEAAQKLADEAAAELKASQDKATAAEKELTDLKAAIAAEEAKRKEDPQRKTLSAAELLSKYGKGDGKDEGGEANLDTVLASIDTLNLDRTESMKLKMQARAEFATKKEVQ
jgi:hypothetical protein